MAAKRPKARKDCPCHWCARLRGEHKPTLEFVEKLVAMHAKPSA